MWEFFFRSTNLKYNALHSTGSLARYVLNSRHSLLCSYLYLWTSINKTACFFLFFNSSSFILCSISALCLLVACSLSIYLYTLTCFLVLNVAYSLHTIFLYFKYLNRSLYDWKKVWIILAALTILQYTFRNLYILIKACILIALLFILR